MLCHILFYCNRIRHNTPYRVSTNTPEPYYGQNQTIRPARDEALQQRIAENRQRGFTPIQAVIRANSQVAQDYYEQPKLYTSQAYKNASEALEVGMMAEGVGALAKFGIKKGIEQATLASLRRGVKPASSTYVNMLDENLNLLSKRKIAENTLKRDYKPWFDEVTSNQSKKFYKTIDDYYASKGDPTNYSRFINRVEERGRDNYIFNIDPEDLSGTNTIGSMNKWGDYRINSDVFVRENRANIGHEVGHLAHDHAIDLKMNKVNPRARDIAHPRIDGVREHAIKQYPESALNAMTEEMRRDYHYLNKSNETTQRLADIKRELVRRGKIKDMFSEDVTVDMIRELYFNDNYTGRKDFLQMLNKAGIHSINKVGPLGAIAPIGVSVGANNNYNAPIP